jgi:hypothetical protein
MTTTNWKVAGNRTTEALAKRGYASAYFFEDARSLGYPTATRVPTQVSS